MKPAHIILLAFLPLTLQAADRQPLRLDLSDDTRNLLKQEMTHVKTAMESLVFDVASANWDKIAETGHNIKNSYILKQKLSKQQMHELHMALPDDFQKLDEKFHYYAGMLAHAAKEHDMQLVQFYRYKMNESCTECHARYSGETFTGFRMNNQHQRHMH